MANVDDVMCCFDARVLQEATLILMRGYIHPLQATSLLADGLLLRLTSNYAEARLYVSTDETPANLVR